MYKANLRIGWVESMIAVQKLRVEYKENPLGLDTLSPRISWQVRADKIEMT